MAGRQLVVLYNWELTVDPGRWCAASQNVPFPSHVSLIMIAACEGGFGETGALVLDEPAGVFKSEDASRGLGRDPEFAAKSLAEMTPAPAQFAGEGLDGQATVGLCQPAPDPRHFARGLDWHQRTRKLVIENSEELAPSASLFEPHDEPACPASPDVGKIEDPTR